MWRAGPALVLVLCGVVGGAALRVRVHGDILFGLQLSEAAQQRLARAQPPAPPRPAPRSPAASTPAPGCRYRFPEQAQIDAILSNMMNELTKVFVRANLLLKSEENARSSRVWRAEDAEPGNSTSSALLPASPASRGSTTESSITSSPSPSTSPSPPLAASSPPPPPSAQMTIPAAHSNRFKVVSSKKTQFFEHIFRNMTDEFSSLYKGSEHAARARSEPCAQQSAVRRAWRDLLRRSLAVFRSAALNCVQDYLKMQECGERTKARLVRFLVRELGKMRARHLDLLCDRFQVCLEGGLHA